jgi:hypothetical protein
MRIGLGLDLAVWKVEAGAATFGIRTSHHEGEGECGLVYRSHSGINNKETEHHDVQKKGP